MLSFDSWEGNTDDMFCAFAVAIASTRAEARREKLRLRSCSRGTYKKTLPRLFVISPSKTIAVLETK